MTSLSVRGTHMDLSPLPEAPARPEPPPAWSSLSCSVLYTDVAGFSSPARDESDRQVVRECHYEMLRRAFEDSGVSWAACYREDRGDGALIVVPPEVPTRAVADPLLPVLAAELRRHNRRSSAAVRIRLRVALHVGPVTRDGEGLNGDALIHAARMLDAPPLREALRSSEADLAFMASAHVYESVLRNDPGLLDPRAFTRVRFQVKESDITGWMYVSHPPALAVPAGAAHATGGPVQVSAEPPAAPVPIAHFHEAVRVEGDLVLGHKIINGG